jgi:DNA modification methylase
LSGIDWDFTGSFSDSAFSRVHWHPGRFVSQIPATLIGLLSAPGDCVLDVFCGSGTTLVEAQRLGRRSIGFDLNPVSVMVCKAKTLPVSARRLGTVIETIIEDARVRLESPLLVERPPDPTRPIPEGVQRTKWYTRRVMEDLTALWQVIGTYGKSKRLLAEASFSAILLPVCRETRHWGYVCDNTRPLDNRSGDVFAEYVKVLRRLQAAYQARDEDRLERLSRVGSIERAVVTQGDSQRLVQTLGPASIDLVITSPPYEGVCDYVKSQRLSMEWFGQDIEPLRSMEIGARSKRHRGSAHAEYLEGLEVVFAGMLRALKPGGYAAIVVGQSESRKGTVSHIRRCAEAVGFSIAVDMNRTVTSQRRQAPSIHDEHTVLLRRT